MQTILFILFGYLSGSILYARIFSNVFRKENMIENSKDQNPGAANAFKYGGFWCGALTLICDLLKGFIPVFFYMRYIMIHFRPVVLATSLVLASPVIGHAFPLFYKWKGGKGITVTFGCLLGLLPIWQPFATLAAFFIFFSLVFRITPHFYRTLIAYFCSLFCMACLVTETSIWIGFLFITAAVYLCMAASSEEKEKMKVRILWMH